MNKVKFYVMQFYYCKAEFNAVSFGKTATLGPVEAAYYCRIAQ